MENQEAATTTTTSSSIIYGWVEKRKAESKLASDGLKHIKTLVLLPFVLDGSRLPFCSTNKPKNSSFQS